MEKKFLKLITIILVAVSIGIGAYVTLVRIQSVDTPTSKFEQTVEEPSKGSGVPDRGNTPNTSPIIPQPVAAPFFVTWISPSDAITIKRGENIPLTFKTQGGQRGNFFYFDLDSESNDPSMYSTGQSLHFDSYEASLGDFIKKVDFKVEVPPGSYLLSLKIGGKKEKVVHVEVTGPSPNVSTARSFITYFYGYEVGGTGMESIFDESEIIDDGICHSAFLVRVADEYGYGIADKKVEIKSSRGDVDSISPLSDYQGQTGEMGFTVTSTDEGISELTVRVEGVTLDYYLILKVLNAKENKCRTVRDMEHL
ncbi:hypothetical protein A2671_00720 [Candidatus Kaiserbacteria bacterium RIFCSPHIGHO2_01_FULL_49_13]|uniref:Uncharacterized protein n=1 Tax=Candidatus Kaiserbacteria bacterium RIFCSPHIGHO2_01_FULL_49_13 TaxID=1798477 RepID=A0A1F6CE44_9BACT|nr:MAG: hypothetical protein A2671_00720 [Candidatus Kaiserbacteria bacterium RIFCSPHIGHO2_01_FULL_49_13]